jgi:hypothetical protein
VVRAAAMVEALTPEQREVLFPAGKANKNIGTNDLEALAGLEPEPRRKAISLAASGMAWGKAIAEHTPKPEPPDPDKPKPEEELSNQDWIATYCSKILPKLQNRAAFENEAIKWREFRTRVRKKAQSVVKELLDLWRSRRAPGLYEKQIYSMWWIAHPNDWVPCGNCGATGSIPMGAPRGEPCPTCEGGGFKLKVERWE